MNVMMIVFFLAGASIVTAPPSVTDRRLVPAVHAMVPSAIFPTAMRRSNQPGFMGIPFSDTPYADSVSRYPEVPAWSEAVPNPKASDIEKLCESATQYKQDQQYDKAEAALNEALALNEPYFNPGIYRYLLDELAVTYKMHHKGFDLEKLYQSESKRLSLWDSQPFRDRIADFYMQEGRLVEDWAILRHSAKTLKPPASGGFCGTPYHTYRAELLKLDTCARAAKDITQEQLDRIEVDIKERYSEAPMK